MPPYFPAPPIALSHSAFRPGAQGPLPFAGTGGTCRLYENRNGWVPARRHSAGG
ncbi:hypothetical protein D3C87_2002260 [compost metagenome]